MKKESTEWERERTKVRESKPEMEEREGGGGRKGERETDRV